jgi:hypothetical protein
MGKDKYDRILAYLFKDKISILNFSLKKVQEDIPVKAKATSGVCNF